jgi:hypothetical protein
LQNVLLKINKNLEENRSTENLTQEDKNLIHRMANLKTNIIGEKNRQQWVEINNTINNYYYPIEEVFKEITVTNMKNKLEIIINKRKSIEELTEDEEKILRRYKKFFDEFKKNKNYSFRSSNNMKVMEKNKNITHSIQRLFNKIKKIENELKITI